MSKIESITLTGKAAEEIETLHEDNDYYIKQTEQNIDAVICYIIGEVSCDNSESHKTLAMKMLIDLLEIRKHYESLESK